MGPLGLLMLVGLSACAVSAARVGPHAPGLIQPVEVLHAANDSYMEVTKSLSCLCHCLGVIVFCSDMSIPKIKDRSERVKRSAKTNTQHYKLASQAGLPSTKMCEP